MKPRPSRPGTTRSLSDDPDRTERCVAKACPHCGTAVSAERQRCRHRYDHIDLPEIRPVVMRVELFGGRCGGCGTRYRAEAPLGKPPGSPFGPGIRSLLLSLHHSHHVSYERLAGLSRDLFGLKSSDGVIANIFQATTKAMEKARTAIRERLVKAQVIASDETTTRIDGVTHWHWVFLSKDAILHDIAPRRAKSVAETVLDGHRPEVWISDRYAGQQDLAQAHQVCLAHVLRDVQYAIDCGDSVFAPRIRTHLRWAIRVGKRRESLKDSTLKNYAARAERRLDDLLTIPVAHPAGNTLQRQIKAKLISVPSDRDRQTLGHRLRKLIRGL